MKNFRLDARVMNNRDAEAMGDTTHQRQADIHVQAKTKKAAIELLDTLGYGPVRTPHLVEDCGNSFDAMVEADLFDTDSILLTSINRYDTVVRSRFVAGRIVSEAIGTLRYASPRDSNYSRVFIPRKDS